VRLLENKDGEAFVNFISLESANQSIQVRTSENLLSETTITPYSLLFAALAPLFLLCFVFFVFLFFSFTPPWPPHATGYTLNPEPQQTLIFPFFFSRRRNPIKNRIATTRHQKKKQIQPFPGTFNPPPAFCSRP